MLIIGSRVVYGLSKRTFLAVPVCCFLACSGAAFGSASDAASAASAPAGASDVNPSMAPSVKDPNEIICHKSERPTGSNIPAKGRCQTRAQWQQEEADAKKLNDDLLRQQSH